MKIAEKKFALMILTLILVIGFLSSVSAALTITLENARMTLSKNEKAEPLKTGDVLEKTIGVKNVNDEAVNVEVSASGDLEKYIDIKDKKFELQPGERKDIRFILKVAKEGATESRINVKFSSLTEKNGIGLSSIITVIAQKGTSIFDSGDENTEDNTKTGFGKKLGILEILGIITAVLVIIFIVLLIISKNKKSKEVFKENKKEVKEEFGKRQEKTEETKPKKRVRKK